MDSQFGILALKHSFSSKSSQVAKHMNNSVLKIHIMVLIVLLGILSIVEKLQLTDAQHEPFLKLLSKSRDARLRILAKYGFDGDGTLLGEKPSLVTLEKIGNEMTELRDKTRKEFAQVLDEQQLARWDKIVNSLQRGIREWMIRQ